MRKLRKPIKVILMNEAEDYLAGIDKKIQLKILQPLYADVEKQTWATLIWLVKSFWVILSGPDCLSMWQGLLCNRMISPTIQSLPISQLQFRTMWRIF